MTAEVQRVYEYAFVPTTAVPFVGTQVPLGVASAIFTTSAVTSLTVLMANGTSVVMNNLPISTLVPVRCTMVTFSGGTLVCLG